MITDDEGDLIPYTDAELRELLGELASDLMGYAITELILSVEVMDKERFWGLARVSV